MSEHLILSNTEHDILESYKPVLDGLSQYLGDGYELILHSLEDPEHSVIKIINGHYTGRTEGSPLTEFTLSMLDNMKQKEEPAALSYFNKKNGKTLKSSIIPILGEHKRIIGLLCINLHMESPLFGFISSFIPEVSYDTVTSENFSENVEDLISYSLEDAKLKVYSDTSISSTNKNKEIIHLLYEKGIFNMKDAVIKVASNLGISKNTVYLHLRNFEK